MTIACEDRDFPEWHRGIPHAYLWGLLVPVDLAPARAALDGLLLPRYERQPHITVAYGGLAGQEFDDDRLADDLRRLGDVAGDTIAVRPWRWDTFLPSPILEIESRWILDAHRVLAEGIPMRIPKPYRPHVTAGFYAGEWPLHEPLARLASVPLPEPWVASSLQLLRYDTHDIAGPLTVVGDWDLATRTYTSR